MTSCKLTLVGSLAENHTANTIPNLPKSIMVLDDPEKPVTIGRENSKSKVSYVLGDSSKPRVVSRLHATVRYNGDDGSFWLTDQSVNGTYVNYVRVSLGGVKLDTGDIVCFFHRNGANIKPGEKVEPFDTHLKYHVDFVDEEEGGGIGDEEEEEARVSRQSLAVGVKRARSTVSPVSGKRARSAGGRRQTSGGVRRGARTQQSSQGQQQPQEENEEVCAAAAEGCLRPIGLAIDWVQCDSCLRWYHQMCVHAVVVDPSEPFFCPTCR